MSRRQAALRGALATVLGIVFIIWPNITIATAVALFAAYCVADGATQLSDALGGHESGDQVAAEVVLTLLDVAAATVALAWPGPTAGVLALVVGFWAIVTGGTELWAGFDRRSGHLGVTGILSVAAGVALFAWPKIGPVSLAIVLGIYLAIHGIALLLAAAEAPDNGLVADPLPTPERGIA